ncbi:hypothetical protein LL12F53_39660 [Escherichia coli]|nr:hypothetical protein VEE30_45690 [Escherichia coli]BEA94895.1 hypothetical protein VEE29_45600 [Escherichia coli]
MDYVPADAACLYDENSASADSKYGGPFCDSTGIPAVAESETTLENHIVDTVQRQPAVQK